MQEAQVTQEEAESAKEDAGREPFEENEEETSTNPEEEETSEEETSNEEGQESSEETPDKASQELKEKNKQLFERAKKAEGKLKKYETKKVDEKGDNQIASVDPIELAKTISALKDYSSDELDFIQLVAKGKGLALDEAVETDEVKTYIEAKRLKVVGENKTPSPSSPSSVLGGKTEEELARMNNKQFTKWLKDDMKGRRIGT